MESRATKERLAADTDFDIKTLIERIRAEEHAGAAQGRAVLQPLPSSAPGSEVQQIRFVRHREADICSFALASRSAVGCSGRMAGPLEWKDKPDESSPVTRPASKHLDELEWSSWPPDQVAARGRAQWKELLGSGSACQNDMTVGVVRLRKGESLEPHCHSQPETYFTLSGRGTVTIDGVVHDVDPGRILFIPGSARHQINNVDEEDLMILYAFAISDFSKIRYHF